MTRVRLFFACITSMVLAPIDVFSHCGGNFSFHMLKTAMKSNYSDRRAHITNDQGWVEKKLRKYHL
ncbi:MAG: hypothetical protein UU98_C0044G0001 [Parcubacteria group bacterium GW2011_GWD2_42_14]|nr:MAG: hypothetical protein UU98_C0044G0001 [Parcubacteria group bacterium GW2011_GWD2_42_14]